MIVSTGYDRKPVKGGTRTVTSVPTRSIAGHVVAGQAVPRIGEVVFAPPVVAGDILTFILVSETRMIKPRCKRKRVTVRKLRMVTCHRDELSNGDFRWMYSRSEIIKL